MALLVLLAGCGGGGGSDGSSTPPPPTLFMVSGMMTPAGDSAIDSDTGDTTTVRIPNNDLASAQPVRNPVTVGGYANKTGDEFDGFRVDLASGQVINLFVAEDGSANDLDLALLDAAGNTLAVSESTTKFESITVPGSGIASYFVVPYAFSGASNYVLSIGQQGVAAATHGMHTQAEFLPDQAVVAFREVLRGGEVLAKAMGTGLLASAPGHADLLDLSAVKAKSATAHALDPYPFADPEIDAKHRTLLALKALARRPEVRYAEPNLIRHASSVPNDEFFGLQWHYPLINLPQAWDVTVGSPNVIVAVADTGVRLAHPDLAGQFDSGDPNGVDFVSDPASGRDGDGIDANADDPGDLNQAGSSSFHGTHVAGTIAAASNNNIGVAGVAWNARIMPLRVLGRSGNSFDIMNAVLYAAGLPNSSGAARRADIINLSLGGDGGSQAEQDAYLRARAAGLIVIAAAGNAGDTRRSFPASYDGVVSVASVGRQKQRAYYSQFNRDVDVAAPGGDVRTGNADGVLSTHASDSSGSIVNTLEFQQGTSMAAPHMAGVVALMKSVHPRLTPAQLDQLLASGAITEDLGAPGRDDQFGHGLVDASKAVREALRLAGGATPPANPRLAVLPGALDFGSGAVSASIDARNADDSGTLSVGSVSDDAPWLTVAAQSVDADGVGRYTVSVDRSGLAVGSYSGTITFVSDQNTVSVPVLMRVGAASGSVDAGKQYVLLVNADTLDAVAQDDQLVSGGRYAFALNVPAGRYLLISGTDSDEDGLICDDGEACGAFPTLDSPQTLTVGPAQSSRDFLVSFDLSAPAEQSAVSSGARGYRRLR